MTKAKKEFEENHDVPSGLDHLSLVAAGAQLAHSKTDKRLKSENSRSAVTRNVPLRFVPSGHVSSRMPKRPTHTGGAVCASLQSSMRRVQFADDRFSMISSLRLVRGIGEIYHLVALSAADQSAVPEWIRSDKATRIREFSPGKVRAKLRKLAPELEFTQPAWYSDISERYTHVNPAILPNKHNPEKAVAGGLFQRGRTKSLP